MGFPGFPNNEISLNTEVTSEGLLQEKIFLKCLQNSQEKKEFCQIFKKTFFTEHL